jgi:hypothetical protein
MLWIDIVLMPIIMSITLSHCIDADCIDHDADQISILMPFRFQILPKLGSVRLICNQQHKTDHDAGIPMFIPNCLSAQQVELSWVQCRRYFRARACFMSACQWGLVLKTWQSTISTSNHISQIFFVFAIPMCWCHWVGLVSSTSNNGVL